MKISYDELYEQWVIGCNSRPKKSDQIAANFDELFQALKDTGATLQEAKAYLQKAIKSQQPPSIVQKRAWNIHKNNPKLSGVTFQEWSTSWLDSITTQGNTSFYLYFPLTTTTEDDQPKLYGDNKITSKEHMLQLSHADDFEMIGGEQLEYENNVLTEEEMLAALGDKNE